MDDLRLACPCGHAPDRHDDAGCRGDHASYCDCRRQRWLALEAAIVTNLAVPEFALTPA